MLLAYAMFSSGSRQATMSDNFINISMPPHIRRYNLIDNDPPSEMDTSYAHLVVPISALLLRVNCHLPPLCCFLETAAAIFIYFSVPHFLLLSSIIIDGNNILQLLISTAFHPKINTRSISRPLLIL